MVNLLLAIANVESPIIATGGLVRAQTTKLVWNHWDLPVEDDVIGDLVIEQKDYDQVLYLSQGGAVAIKLIIFINLFTQYTRTGNVLGSGGYFITPNCSSFVQT